MFVSNLYGFYFYAILIPLYVDFWKGFKDAKISQIFFQIFLKYNSTKNQ